MQLQMLLALLSTIAVLFINVNECAPTTVKATTTAKAAATANASNHREGGDHRHPGTRSCRQQVSLALCIRQSRSNVVRFQASHHCRFAHEMGT